MILFSMTHITPKSENEREKEKTIRSVAFLRSVTFRKMSVFGMWRCILVCIRKILSIFNIVKCYQTISRYGFR